MVVRDDYSKKEVDGCLSVLVELMTILGEFRDNMVLVGGWIPYFLMEKNRHEHVGSLDIDIALDFQKISDDTYKTILQLLKSRGYVELVNLIVLSQFKISGQGKQGAVI